MTIKQSTRRVKVAYGNGYIDWHVLYAVDDKGLVQVVIMGGDYNRCLIDMMTAIAEVS